MTTNEGDAPEVIAIRWESGLSCRAVGREFGDEDWLGDLEVLLIRRAKMLFLDSFVGVAPMSEGEKTGSR